MFIVNIALKFFASGSYTVIYIYANELFPTEVRNTGIGICSMVSRVGAIFGTLFNDLLVMRNRFRLLNIFFDTFKFRLVFGYIFQSLHLV